MIKRIIILIFFLLFSIFANSQAEKLSHIDQVNELVSELFAAKVDTICDYEVFEMNNKKAIAQYIFWKKNGKTKLTKIYFDKRYSPIEIECENIWQFLFSNIETINTERPKIFEFKHGNEIFPYGSRGPNIRHFHLYLNRSYFKFWTNSFDFQKTEKYENQEVENINYDYNNNLKGKVTIDMFQKLIEDLEKRMLFKA